ncbi:MAG TPA: hypothetical protein VIF82_10045 [Burkholderiaceae bacterium]|jgi:hypothetical protein
MRDFDSIERQERGAVHVTQPRGNNSKHRIGLDHLAAPSYLRFGTPSRALNRFLPITLTSR